MKPFFIALGVCTILFLLGLQSLAIWGFIIFCLVWSSDIDTEESSAPYCSSTAADDEPAHIPNTSEHRGAAYHPGGSMTYLPNGETAFSDGSVTYLSNKIYSVNKGNVTDYFYENGKQAGYSVNNGNGIHYYFDSHGRELGHSTTSGNITDFFGDCFECR